MAFFKSKRVVVTGGSGFIGSHFVRRLLQQGAEVVVPIHQRKPQAWSHCDVQIIQANLFDQDSCRKVLEGSDIVIHAAGAVSAAGVTTGTNPMSPITANLTLTAQIIEACWSARPERLLIFSSSTGYPAFSHPVKEDEMWNADPHDVYFGYGWMRRYLEKISEFLYRRTGVQVALIRPTATYGPFDDFDPKTSHVIPALIRRAVVGEHPFEVWGTGEEIRDFLYVEDLVEGCLLSLEKHASCDPINIGSGESTTIREIVRCILEKAGRSNCEPVFRPDKPSTIPIRMVDCTKARLSLGFKPKYTLAQGIEKTVDYFRDLQKSRNV